MKIHIIANHAQEFMYARFLRDSGHDVLFFTDGVMHPRLSLGWYFDTLSQADLDMIRYEEFLTVSPLSGNIHATHIMRAISDCDILHVNNIHGLWAAMSGKPYIYHHFGGDLTRWPFLEDTETDRMRAFFMRLILQRASAIPGALYQKRYAEALDRLGIDYTKAVPWNFSIDADKHRPLPKEEWEDLRRELGGENRFVILLGSQLVIHQTRQMNYAKGVDIFAKGVAEFVKKVGADNVAFWVIDRGHQKEEFKALASQLGLDPVIRWLEPCKHDMFIRLMNASDVVLDQIVPNIGNHGYLALEALSCGKPLFIHIDQDHREKIGMPRVPVVNVLTPGDVTEALVLLQTDPILRSETGERGRHFVLKHHHWLSSTKELVKIYKKAIEDHNPVLFDPILPNITPISLGGQNT